jgi:tetratricopeptide (TPR) repeat protein
MRNVQHIRALRKQGKHELARQLGETLSVQYPHDAVIQYETACVHDFLGLGAQAMTYYRTALAADLPEKMRHGAYLGLCSTCRARGLFHEALAVAEAGLLQFPQSAVLRVLRGMTRYNLGDSHAALNEILDVLCETSVDPLIQQHRVAIQRYAQDLDRQWL